MTADADFRLLLVRHGETALNTERRMQGVSDLGLDERGRRQLAAVAARLSGEPVAAIYASDLARAVESAEIVAAPHGLEVRREPRLREQDMGDWEGLVWLDLPALVGRETVGRFVGDLDFAPPGGESKGAVLARVREAMAEIAARHAGETAAVVTHGGPVQVFLQDALGIPFGPERRLYAQNAGVTEMLFTEGYWRLVTFNETSFLGDDRTTGLARE